MIVAMALSLAQANQARQVTEPAVPPQLLNKTPVIGPDDYPNRAFIDGDEGIVSTVLHIREDGRAAACEVTETSGVAALDKATCSILLMRARFVPARTAAGAVTRGDWRTATVWGVGAEMPSVSKALPLQVKRLPADYGSPVQMRAIFDATGHLSSCEVTASSGSAAADRAACAYAKGQLTIAPPRSGSPGVAPAAVRHITATLSTDP
ncbi:energy transducer TonB [Sphingomonas aerophila]|jgi:outer membrane biosynthesis protein TonB|uniref:Outer membrane biosynthesis protein TonB n=1 Tax=Sphingomonas aerophila TaxID=1344948 RepID=A0A7W9BCF3_9SPHN|nr:energy transducer TonB [Sphingomonas aerophila]MBB5714463.1 outer membrane biosynthesis protein TonB [Sphingomonas aerophila]